MAYASFLVIALAAGANSDTTARRTLHGRAVCTACVEGAGDDCARRCAEGRADYGLIVATGAGEVIWRLTGAEADLADHLGKRLQVTGFAARRDGERRLEVEQVVPESPAGVELGDVAPGLRLRDLDGAWQSLHELRGQVVVLNFWATWCGPCRAEMPTLERVARAHRDVVVIGAAADGEPRLDAVRRVLRERGVTYPIWLGANLGDQRAFGFDESIPATVVLDRSGRVAWRKRGVVNEDELARAIAAATAAADP